MNLPIEIWIQILEHGLKKTRPKYVHHHGDDEKCNGACVKACLEDKKDWISVRKFAQINKTSRTAADKLILADAPGSDIWGPPVPVYMVTGVLGSEWSPACRQV